MSFGIKFSWSCIRLNKEVGKNGVSEIGENILSNIPNKSEMSVSRIPEA